METVLTLHELFGHKASYMFPNPAALSFFLRNLISAGVAPAKVTITDDATDGRTLFSGTPAAALDYAYWQRRGNESGR